MNASGSGSKRVREAAWLSGAAALVLCAMCSAAEQSPPTSGAQSAGSPPSADALQGLPGWYLIWENDAVAAFSGSDEFYTQGIQLGYSFDPAIQSLALKPVSDWLTARVVPDSAGFAKSAATWFIGQHMFTPGDLSREELIRDDRPYAGWLYGGARFDIGYAAAEASTVYHTFELQLGLTGPLANAEWSQRQFHKLIGDELPMGWDNQLPTEWGVMARYKWQRRFPLHDGSFEIDLWPEGEAAVGNVQTYGQAGGVLRFGRNLGDPATAVLTPSVHIPSSASTGRACASFRWAPDECYLYVGASARGVARNMFLDGAWLRDSHSVDREPFVYDLRWGLRLRWRSVQFDYSFVRRSREFSPVPATADALDGEHDYGSVNVRCLAERQLLCPAAVVTLLGLLFAQ